MKIGTQVFAPITAEQSEKFVDMIGIFTSVAEDMEKWLEETGNKNIFTESELSDILLHVSGLTTFGLMISSIDHKTGMPDTRTLLQVKQQMKDLVGISRQMKETRERGLK